jgi:hypothetical protein
LKTEYGNRNPIASQLTGNLIEITGAELENRNQSGLFAKLIASAKNPLVPQRIGGSPEWH